VQEERNPENAHRSPQSIRKGKSWAHGRKKETLYPGILTIASGYFSERNYKGLRLFTPLCCAYQEGIICTSSYFLLRPCQVPYSNSIERRSALHLSCPYIRIIQHLFVVKQHVSQNLIINQNKRHNLLPFASSSISKTLFSRLTD
jgi:hypothetical protein